VIVNVGIVVTGGVVRLTGSGLGCPTWPKCTDESYVTTAAMGHHGLIEFGNRTLIGIVGGVALISVLLAWLQKRSLVPAVAILAGVAVQGVAGGITVRMQLNPYTVAVHFLLSMGMLVLAHWFWMTTREKGPSWPAPRAVQALGVVLTTVSALVLVLGTVVTGSGPHAGDAKAARTGFDPQAVSQLHADGVFLLIGLSIAAWLALKAVKGPTRAALILVVIELSQGVIGFVQYFTHLPIAVVLAHMLGACLVWLATLSALSSMRGTVLARQQPEEQLVGPLALGPDAADQAALALEAEPLQQSRGADVAPVAAGRDPV
jgi:cytochrome c oxidase assembly protein subunit 15